MFNREFAFDILRKNVVAFGDLFNEVILLRKNEQGQVTEKFKVPITYAPKQKYVIRGTDDPALDKQVSIVYPRMSFAIKSINYDASRKIITTQRNIKESEPGRRKSQYAPVPYNLMMELSITGKNQYDVFQILEKILPYFTPKLTVNIHSIPELDLRDDVDITIVDHPKEDTFDGQFADLRTITWSIGFKMSIAMYGEIVEQGLIRKVQADLLIPTGIDEITSEVMNQTPRSARIVTEPDPIDAEPDEDYGFTTSIYEYDDGLKYNPITDEDEPVPGSEDEED